MCQADLVDAEFGTRNLRDRQVIADGLRRQGARHNMWPMAGGSLPDIVVSPFASHASVRAGQDFRSRAALDGGIRFPSVFRVSGEEISALVGFSALWDGFDKGQTEADRQGSSTYQTSTAEVMSAALAVDNPWGGNSITRSMATGGEGLLGVRVRARTR